MSSHRDCRGLAATCAALERACLKLAKTLASLQTEHPIAFRTCGALGAHARLALSLVMNAGMEGVHTSDMLVVQALIFLQMLVRCPSYRRRPHAPSTLASHTLELYISTAMALSQRASLKARGSVSPTRRDRAARRCRAWSPACGPSRGSQPRRLICVAQPAPFCSHAFVPLEFIVFFPTFVGVFTFAERDSVFADACAGQPFLSADPLRPFGMVDGS